MPGTRGGIFREQVLQPPLGAGAFVPSFPFFRDAMTGPVRPRVPAPRAGWGILGMNFFHAIMNQETSMGGSRESFPETVWSTLLADPESPATREHLDRLCRRYWKPVYGFFRSAGSARVEEAKDLTQEFFHHLLESGLVARYRQDRGRFRDFLKGALRFFLSHERREGRAAKRGGDRITLSLDVGDVETSEFLADLRDRTPEELFDRQWSNDLLERALVRLKETLEADGKAVYFQAYEAYYLAPGSAEPPTYAQLAETLHLKPHDPGNFLAHARERLKAIVRELICEYVASRDEMAGEMKDLFSE